MHKYQLEFFKAKPHSLIFCKALQHAFFGFSHWCWDEDLYDISKFWECLDFLLQTPQVPCLLLSILFHGPVQQKHLSTSLILSQVKYINMLIRMHTLKLTPKCVTILSLPDFKRLVVQVFSERQYISFNNKKIFIFPWSFRPCKRPNYFHPTIASSHIRIKKIALVVLTTKSFSFHLVRRASYWKL